MTHRQGPQLSSAWLAAVVALALAVGATGAHAQGKSETSIEDLKARSASGDRSATRQLAERYYVGRGGVERDFSEAAKWYEQGARAVPDSAGLYNQLAWLYGKYERGRERGLEHP